jgi:hypothetical protein
MSAVGHLDREFAAIDEYWSPRVIAIANGQYVRLAKVKGEFVWHAHAEEDEFFLVQRGIFVRVIATATKRSSRPAISMSCRAARSTVPTPRRRLG